MTIPAALAALGLRLRALDESHDEPICEVPTEGLLESEKRRGTLVPLPAERLDVGEKTKRARLSHLREDGGGHGWIIGSRRRRIDPWREVTARG